MMLGLAYPAYAITYTFSQSISGSDIVPVTVSLTDAAGGNAVDVTVSIPDGQGDLLGFFGNVTVASLIPQMTVSSSGVVTQWQFASNAVSQVGGGNNLNPAKKWDLGLRLGRQGSAGGAVTTASFRLQGPGLTVAHLTGAAQQDGYVFGIRIQSTLGPQGSAKIGMATGTPPVGSPPTVAITSPVEGALLSASPIAVAGSFTGEGVTLTVNGVAATLGAGTFDASLALPDGPHTIIATATNASGPASDAVDVVVDTTAPVVTISAPPDGLATTQASVLVTGSVVDASAIASFTLNGVATPLAADGTFSATVPVAVGTNPILAQATDAAGHPGSAGVTVVRGEAPAIAIVAPVDGLLARQSPVTVSGTVAGTLPLAVTVNGVAATVTGESFTAELALAEGANTLTVIATNAFGSGSDDVSVTLDSTPPVVTITAPADAARTAEASIAVTGTVVDPAPGSGVASLTLNGIGVPLTGGSFSATVPLAEGVNPIQAAAVDAAGNGGSAAIAVTRGTAPTITIDAPTDGLLTNASPIVVSGTVSGTEPVSVTVNGVAATLTGTTFSASVPLSEGANTLTATATNDFGSANDIASVTLDTTPPAVTITAPPDGSTTDAAEVGVFGTIADASPITSLRLGTTTLPPGNAFATTATLEPGPNALRVEAIDAAGNVGHATSTVTYESAQPLTITIASPADGSIVSSAAVPVSGSVSDGSAFVAVNGFAGATSDGGYAVPAVYLVEGENTLVATATRGSETVTAQVSVTYHAPPTVVITAPIDGTTLREPTTDVEGVIDDLTAHVDVNGVVAQVGAGGRFVARAVALQAGENVLTARAVDPFGGQASDRATVLLDPAAAPRLTLLVLDPGHFGGGDPFTGDGDSYPRILASKNLDDFLASMRAIGRPPERFDRPIEHPVVGRTEILDVYALTDSGDDVTAGIDALYGTFTDPPPPFAERADQFANLPLYVAAPDRVLPEHFAPTFYQLMNPVIDQVDGATVSTGLYTARASQGGIEVALPLWIDVEGPQLYVTSPAYESTVAASSITITGTVSDDSPLYDEVQYRVQTGDGAEIARGSAALVGGRFTVPNLPLAPGENRIRFVAEDAGRNVQEGDTLVYSDPAAPAVTLVSPTDGQVFLASRVLADLNFAAPSTLVSVNGVPDGRSFPAGLAAGALDLGLNVGTNPFTLEVATGAGTYTLGFTLFRVAAVEPIQIVAPGEGESLATPTVEVVVRAPLGTPLVAIQGTTVAPDADGVTFRAPVTLRSGANTIRAVAYPFGQEATRSVTLDTRPPRITLAGPTPGSATLAETIDVAGVVDELALVEVEGAGGRVIARRQYAPDLSHPLTGLTAYRWNADGVALADGPNPLTVRATDRAGNVATLEVVVTRQSGALRLASPADGAVTSTLSQQVQLEVLADSVIDAVFVAGRRLANLVDFPAEVGLFNLGTLPLVPGVNDVRVVSHRAATGESEVLGFTLVSTATDFATLTGVVTDQRTGEPIPGALVTISVGGVAYVVVTDALGRYTLPIEPGDVIAVANAPGFVSRNLFSGSVAVGETREASGPLVALYTPPSAPGGGPTRVTLTGTVRSRLTNLPEPGVEIAVLGTDRTTTSDATGRYTLAELTPGSVTLRLRKPDFVDAFFTYDDLRPPSSGYPVRADLDYPIQAGNEETIAVGTTAHGTVRDAFTSQPLAGVEVTAGSLAAVTDAAGAFTLAGLPAGERVSVRAEIAGHDPQTLEAFVVVNATDSLDYALAPRTWAKLSGTVTDAATGEPIHLARIRVAGSSFLSTATERDGSYELTGIPAGSHAFEIEHPAYMPHGSATLVFTNDQASSLTVALTPRPHTGHLTGRVIDRATGSPVAGAVVQPAGGASATSDVEGRYALESVPAGLTALTVTATGYPTATRDVGIVADRDPTQPFSNEADLVIDASGTTPADEVSKVITASEGGFVETPDGRLRLDILPGSLSRDAEVILRRPLASVTTPGAPLSIDPALGAGQIRVLGGETEILVAPLMAGGEKPRLAGPVFVSARYAANVAESSGVAEHTAFPYLFDGSQWTALRTVPYLHAIDEVNKVVVVALLFGQTESGQRVFGYETQRRPTLVAANGDEEPPAGPGDLILDGFRTVLAAAREAATPTISPNVHAIDLAFDETLNPTQDPSDPHGPNRINVFARPLLVFHGWNPSAIVHDTDLIDQPLSDGRYGAILEDLISGTNGVYRPIFVTYNSRMSIAQSGGLIATKLDGLYPPLLATGLDLWALPGEYEKNRPESFEVWDSFGFSMGGLVERVFQAKSVRGDWLGSTGDPNKVGRVQNMVTMGTPHHGALQLLRLATLIGLGFQGLLVEEILETWSPGTLDLLDYAFCGTARNKTLCELNDNPRSTPNGKLSLIGGTKPDMFGVAGLGHFLVGPMTNDGVVPLSSAQGRSTVFRIPVGPLRKGETFANRFDHMNAGTERDENQRISTFAGAEIFPFLSDHYVASVVRRPSVPVCPDESTVGRFELDVDLDFNANQGSVTGATFVVYAQNHAGEWRIVWGADPTSHEFDDNLKSLGGNSRARGGPETLSVRPSLPIGSDVRKLVMQLYIVGERSEDSAAAAPSDAAIERAFECP